MNKPFAERSKFNAGYEFVQKAVKEETNNCIIWPFRSVLRGYARLNYKGRQIGAHRLALVLLTGKDNPNLFAIHGPCKNRLCINPHPVHGMRWGTPKENALDMIRDGTILIGEKNHSAKLGAQQVKEIRELSDSMSRAALARKFHVSSSLVSAICLNQIWTHI